jgi:hypothetical protein
MYNIKKLNETEGKEQYFVEISNRFAALESLDTEVDINRAWETVRVNIKISSRFDEGCSELLDQMKQATLQW